MGQNRVFMSSGFLESSKQSILQLWHTVKQPNVFLPTLFIFLWQATPQSDSAMFFFTYVHYFSSSSSFFCFFFSYYFFGFFYTSLLTKNISCFSTNKLAFTPEFLGRVKLVTSVASLLGVGLYNCCLKKVPLRKIFLVTTIIGSALGMTQVRVAVNISSN